ncbi:hypothetical protein FB192DRAFT_1262825, partial [Mucor lusitanicus]
WEHRIHRYLPVILAFAIIGILTVLGSLIYLAYRLYQASAQRRRRRRQQAENNSDDDEEKKAISPMSATLSNIIPWLAIPSPTRHPTDTEEPYLLPTIDNLNIPISSTFVPIDKSSLTLVPRSEIWLDPHRRRGVDELDMWERKNSGTEIQTIAVPEPQPMWRFPSQQNVYPDSPESFE